MQIVERVAPHDYAVDVVGAPVRDLRKRLDSAGVPWSDLSDSVDGEHGSVRVDRTRFRRPDGREVSAVWGWSAGDGKGLYGEVGPWAHGLTFGWPDLLEVAAVDGDRVLWDPVPMTVSETLELAVHAE